LRTPQEEVWDSEIGIAYTDRSSPSLKEWEQMYIDRFGVTRTQMNTEFIGGLPQDLSILEVGCNVGNQLSVLQGMGFTDLWGIELQWDAVEKAKSRLKNVNIIQGSAFDIPFKDGYFDMVFTSGVLIHFTEEDLFDVMSEINRCAERYIWGYEYFGEKFTEIPWRGKREMMWKGIILVYITSSSSGRYQGETVQV